MQNTSFTPQTQTWFKAAIFWCGTGSVVGDLAVVLLLHAGKTDGIKN